MEKIILINVIGVILNNIIPYKYKISRRIGLIISIITMYIVLYNILKYNTNINEYQNRIEILNYTFGYDGISLSLITLISILNPILILLTKGEHQSEKEQKKIITNLFIITILIILLFGSLDLLVFFITFELILIPMFILITQFGSRYKYFLPRIEAGMRFFIFTMIGSLLMLISIIILYIKFGTTSNELLNYKISNNTFNNLTLFQIIWIFLFFSFLIKIPMFPFHTWLPLAHSDAPTIGSIILAAILLKLASFGILRYSLYLFEDPTVYEIFLPIIFILSILSIYYSSILSIRAIFDIKKIIAYSSIIHMNFSIFGFFSFNLIGLMGSTLLIFSHAFISSALFLLVGILYKRYHTRYLPYLKGLSITMPLYTTMFLLLIFGNISLPFCLSFLSEFFILISSFYINPIINVLLLLSLILSTSAVMFFTIRILFGNVSSYTNSIGYKDLTINEFISLLPFVLFTYLFTFFPQSFLDLFILPLNYLL